MQNPELGVLEHTSDLSLGTWEREVIDQHRKSRNKEAFSLYLQSRDKTEGEDRREQASAFSFRWPLHPHFEGTASLATFNRVDSDRPL